MVLWLGCGVRRDIGGGMRIKWGDAGDRLVSDCERFELYEDKTYEFWSLFIGGKLDAQHENVAVLKRRAAIKHG